MLDDQRGEWRPYYRSVNPTGVAIATLAVGFALGALVMWLLRRTPRRDDPTGQMPGPSVPAGVSEVLAVLTTSGMVIGPHDEVLEATTTARNLGLARGTRIAVPELLTLVREVRRDGRIRDVQLELTRGTGEATTHLDARIATIGDDLVVVVADDQTTARRIEQTRRDFVANVSHELKTPIGAISLLAEAVEGAADDPTAVRRFATRMGVESARLTDLVAQIIELSRLQADDPLAQPEPVDIDEVLIDAVDRSRVDAERRDISLAVAGTPGCRVVGSHRQLSVAVGNLVENAVLYSDPGARVVVAAHVQRRRDDDWVEITVSDSGLGIAAPDLERIFERFYRVDYARNRSNGGTGLGLAIVKHIAAGHGGEVSVWSQPGRGSTFTVRLPSHLADGTDPDQRDTAGVDDDLVVQLPRPDALNETQQARQEISR